ncbi:hypothetical protein AA0115_g1358 [Alternaria tenuissima]|uniref:NACHT-NTPase and P-loop NTPases N-terminal domain-containing protein n=1 Tax=Alternaria tenuissima TaxID=119927 RepID=A0AB37WW52_9PLEO|nr:hypothetical protein AA0115_g1358 [Alternaria tenuissima]
MSGAEVGLVLGIVSSVIAIVEGAKNIYDAAKDAKGLPKAFTQVNGRFPLAVTLLKLTEENLKSKQRLEDSVYREADEVVKQCKTQAENIRDLFKEVIRGENDTPFERYKKAARAIVGGKGKKVEELMAEMLKNIDALVKLRLMSNATEDQLKDLQAAIQEMVEMAPSLPDEGTGGVNQQHTGSGHNVATSGNASSQINNGDGNYIQGLQGGATFNNHSLIKPIINVILQATKSWPDFMRQYSSTPPSPDEKLRDAMASIPREPISAPPNPDPIGTRIDSRRTASSSPSTPIINTENDPSECPLPSSSVNPDGYLVGSTKYRLKKLEDDSDDFTNKDWNRIVALTESPELESWASSKTSAVLVAYDSLWLERNEDVLSYLMASVVTYDEPPSTDITKLYHFCQPKDNVLQVAQDLLRQLSGGMASNSMATTIEQAVSQLVSRLRQLQSTHKVVLFIDGSNARSLDIRQLIIPLYEVAKDNRENNRLGFKLFLIVADRQGWDFEMDDILCNEVPAEGDREAEDYEAQFGMKWAFD